MRALGRKRKQQVKRRLQFSRNEGLRAQKKCSRGACPVADSTIKTRTMSARAQGCRSRARRQRLWGWGRSHSRQQQGSQDRDDNQPVARYPIFSRQSHKKPKKSLYHMMMEEQLWLPEIAYWLKFY